MTVVVKKERLQFEIAAHDGESLFDLVKRGTRLSEFLECACGGNMTCSTCHVYVVNASNSEPVAVSELDMLDLAYEPRENSRLGCQVKLSKDKELVIEVPEEAFNHFK